MCPTMPCDKVFPDYCAGKTLYSSTRDASEETYEKVLGDVARARVLLPKVAVPIMSAGIARARELSSPVALRTVCTALMAPRFVKGDLN